MDHSLHSAPEETPQGGWILYDGECPLCTGLAGKFESSLRRHGLAMGPLQTAWAAQRLALKPGENPDEMKLLTATGEIFGGHHAVAQIARRIWWAWPIFALYRLPGIDPLFRRGYRWIADRRHLLLRKTSC
jgi:predicted DCC family thiol-disulfide oxidoreductase YuxK